GPGQSLLRQAGSEGALDASDQLDPAQAVQPPIVFQSPSIAYRAAGSPPALDLGHCQHDYSGSPDTKGTTMDEELLQPAATILAALIASRPRGGQEMQSAELQNR